MSAVEALFGPHRQCGPLQQHLPIVLPVDRNEAKGVDMLQLGPQSGDFVWQATLSSSAGNRQMYVHIDGNVHIVGNVLSFSHC